MPEPEPRARRPAAPARRRSAEPTGRQPADPPRRRSAEPARSRGRDEDAAAAPRRETPGIRAAEAAARATTHVRNLTGRSPECVTALERTEDGWRISVEVLESRRIPDSTDILAVYEVELDEEGDLVSYRRSGRYHRGRAGQEEQP